MKLKTILVSLTALSLFTAYLPTTTTPTQAAAPFTIQETNLSNDTDTQTDARIAGDIVIWSHRKIENQTVSQARIDVYNLKTKVKTSVTQNDPNINNYSTDGSKVFYLDKDKEDTRENYNNIFAYDIATKKITKTSIDGGRRYVVEDAYSNKLAYLQDNSWSDVNYEAMLYDFKTNTKTEIPENTYDPESLSLHGNYIVSSDPTGSGGYQKVNLYYYDIAKKQMIRPIPNNNMDRYGADVYGDNIVWLENEFKLDEMSDNIRCGYPQGGIGTTCRMAVYNISTKKQKTIRSNAVVGSPQIYKNKVVWSEKRNGNVDIFMYDLSLNKEYQITNNPKTQSDPRIYENKITFTDDRSGNPEIYLAELIYPTSAPKSVVKPSPKPAPKPTVKPTLTLSSLTKLGGKNPPQPITLTAGTAPVLRTDQSFTLSGTTSTNAKITLTIQSDPITTEVTADASGAWSYLLNPKTLNLNPGSHTITAYATDTAGIKSDTIELTKFTLKAPVQPPKPITPEPTNLFTPLNISLTILVLAGIGFLIFRIIKKRRTKNQPIITPKEGI